MKENIYDLLEGKELTKANLYALLKDPRASGLSPKYDANFSATVENALQEFEKHNDPRNVKILRENSTALNMCSNDEITFENICHWKKDKRYSDPNYRDPFYVKAVQKAVEEFAAVQEKQIQVNKEADGVLLK